MTKDTKDKVRLDLVPIHGKEAVARVREFGNKKYPQGGPFNYLNGTVTADSLVVAAQRHIDKHLKAVHYSEVEESLYDDESGLLHIAHAACSLLMAIDILSEDKIFKNVDEFMEHIATLDLQEDDDL
jgi:hypothetical protein